MQDISKIDIPARLKFKNEEERLNALWTLAKTGFWFRNHEDGTLTVLAGYQLYRLAQEAIEFDVVENDQLNCPPKIRSKLISIFQQKLKTIKMWQKMIFVD